MTPDTTSVAILAERPGIHVWMTPEEAASTLSTSAEAIERQLDEGDLESRVNDGGVLEVLICLPTRASAPRIDELSNLEETLRPAASIGQTMMPLIQAMRYTSTAGDDLRIARRSARRAYALAAAVMIAAGGAVAISGTLAVRARHASNQATQHVDDSALETAKTTDERTTLETEKQALAGQVEMLSAERDQLKSQLAQATDSLSKVQGDLVVERNVEDQLLQAALASHAAKGTSKNQVVADGSN